MMRHALMLMYPECGGVWSACGAGVCLQARSVLESIIPDYCMFGVPWVVAAVVTVLGDHGEDCAAVHCLPGECPAIITQAGQGQARDRAERGEPGSVLPAGMRF